MYIVGICTIIYLFLVVEHGKKNLSDSQWSSDY